MLALIWKEVNIGGMDYNFLVDLFLILHFMKHNPCFGGI
jgi:hypothetical protein